VLFRTTETSKLYAAKISSGNSYTATLIWHLGNVYTATEAPTLPTFTRSAQECVDALEYTSLNAESRFKVSF